MTMTSKELNRRIGEICNLIDRIADASKENIASVLRAERLSEARLLNRIEQIDTSLLALQKSLFKDLGIDPALAL